MRLEFPADGDTGSDDEDYDKDGDEGAHVSNRTAFALLAMRCNQAADAFRRLQ